MKMQSGYAVERINDFDDLSLSPSPPPKKKNTLPGLQQGVRTYIKPKSATKYCC